MRIKITKEDSKLFKEHLKENFSKEVDKLSNKEVERIINNQDIYSFSFRYKCDNNLNLLLK